MAARARQNRRARAQLLLHLPFFLPAPLHMQHPGSGRRQQLEGLVTGLYGCMGTACDAASTPHCCSYPFRFFARRAMGVDKRAPLLVAQKLGSCSKGWSAARSNRRNCTWTVGGRAACHPSPRADLFVRRSTAEGVCVCVCVHATFQ